jgi:hypothetical protein
MSDSPNVLELMLAMNSALDKAAAAYKDYIVAVKKAREAAEALSVALETIINQPHIEIQDYEIDG